MVTLAEMVSMIQTEQVPRYKTFYCALCEQRVYRDADGYRKHGGKPVWIHATNSVPWCPRDKQHGPKTRRALPVPSLLVIQELGVFL